MNPVKELSATDLGPQTRKAFKLALSRDQNIINSGLNDVIAKCESMHCMELAIWLRITSQWSDKLSNWPLLLKLCLKACEEQGLPSEDVLFGLTTHKIL